MSKRLRSHAWFEDKIMKFQGQPLDAVDGRPIIGICNTWSETAPCNSHFRELAAKVKNGVWESGGFPLEFNVIGLGEPFMRPTTMLYRNLLSMDVEEMIRANPFDGVVILSGCDKTQPATLLGAASCNLPTIVVTGGPTLNGQFKGRVMASGTDLFKMIDRRNNGEITGEELSLAVDSMWRSPGFCNTMGTASTMSCITETMGMALTFGGSIPAADSNRDRHAHQAGRQIVKMVHDEISLSKIITRRSLENAIKVTAALGGSTNVVIHLLALARRLAIPLELEEFDTLVRDIPLLINLKPHGEYLMEDFHYAGGVPAVLKELESLLHLDCLTVTGQTLGETIKGAECYNRSVIHALDKPFGPPAGVAVLKGSLCPMGAVIKTSVVSKRLMVHRGQALVFDSVEDLMSNIHRDDLPVTADSVLILRNAGPKGYPGMPEVSNLPIPRKLLKEGVVDMIRICDGRMSGTAYGTVVLHVSPEAAVGGPLALVKTGDWIRLDVPGRTLDLEISAEELERRRSAWKPSSDSEPRGYTKLYVDHVEQAHLGADLDFLTGSSVAKNLRKGFSV